MKTVKPNFFNNKPVSMIILMIAGLVVLFPTDAMALDLQAKIQNKDNAVGWGTLALINAGIAQGKNRSGINWFLASLILGPVATFLLVISEKRFLGHNDN